MNDIVTPVPAPATMPTPIARYLAATDRRIFAPPQTTLQPFDRLKSKAHGIYALSANPTANPIGIQLKKCYNILIYK
ncbi:hypothetical protein [Methylovirgula sp. HY1]|uniref:hypothetical protein n=1 Tax=Methylovirgula sp. HY1 TaxID=2822761 RepID=UPI001C5AF596|nr:hypothetical protein [Methylovirgula sp. HY1]